MPRIKLLASLLTFQLLVMSVLPSWADGIDKKVKRVLFLGNSITYSGQYIAFAEAWFAVKYPDRKIEFINAGLPSETVSGLSEEGHAGGKFPRPDLHERLARVLQQTKPDLIIASYGINDGIYKAFSDERFQKFKDGMKWLHDEAVKSGASIIHLTPSVYDDTKGAHKGYSFVLGRYADWLLNQRNEAKWNVADVHFAMRKELEDKREKNYKFYFASDGIHPDDAGHWVIAKQILLYFGEKKVKNAESIQEALKDHPKGQEILGLIKRRQDIMKDAWLTAAGHTRPGMNKGLSLTEAKAQAAEIQKQLNQLLAVKK